MGSKTALTITAPRCFAPALLRLTAGRALGEVNVDLLVLHGGHGLHRLHQDAHQHVPGAGAGRGAGAGHFGAISGPFRGHLEEAPIFSGVPVPKVLVGTMGWALVGVSK